MCEPLLALIAAFPWVLKNHLRCESISINQSIKKSSGYPDLDVCVLYVEADI